jgi:predicted ester cyclase
MSTEENKVIARRVLEEVVGKGDFSIANELVDSNYVFHGAGGEVRGIEGMIKDITSHSTAIPDGQVKTFKDQIAEGDKVVTRFTFQGTHTGGDLLGIAPTNKKFAISGIIISRIVNGKVVEEWEALDLLGMMQQLGVIPPMGQ